MFRLSLALCLCLALPVNAASSLYVHLHTDGGHQNEHHDGREVHRHAEPVETHHDGEHPDEPNPDPAPVDEVTVVVATAAWRPALSLVSATMASATGAPWLHPSAPSHALRSPAALSAIVSLPPPGLPDSPTISTPALRGPPR